MKVTEREMSDGAWKGISYDKVPAKANLRYDGAFYRHDRERREQYLDSLADSSEGVLILSDMEFDMAVSAPVTARLWDQMESRFQASGYELPRLIFWNLCGSTGTIPMTDNGRGLSLISGFSQNAISAARGYCVRDFAFWYKCTIAWGKIG